MSDPALVSLCNVLDILHGEETRIDVAINDSVVKSEVCVDSSTNAIKTAVVENHDSVSDEDTTLIAFEEEGKVNAKCLAVWLVVSGLGSQYPGMAAPMMTDPVFKQKILECASTIEHTGIDLVSLVTDTSEKTADLLRRSEHAFVAIISVQIALIEALTSKGIVPEGFLGHSIGEITCAYLDGHISLADTMRIAHTLGCQSSRCQGAMAAIQMSAQQFLSSLHPDLYIACRNSATSITIAGPEANITSFVFRAKNRGLLATTIASTNVAFHCRLMQLVANDMRQELRSILPFDPRARSPRWISTSNLNARVKFSGEYLVQNLVTQVKFEAAVAQMPNDCIVFEIGAHHILEPTVKESRPNASFFPLMSRKNSSPNLFQDSISAAVAKGNLTLVLPPDSK